MPPVLPPIVDFWNPYVFTGMVRDIPIPSDYIGEQFLPEQDVPGDKLEYETLKEEIPLAPFSDIDAESPVLDRQMLTAAWAEVAHMRYKLRYKESDVRILRDFGMAPQFTLQANMRAAAQNKIDREVAVLKRSIDARKEWMRIQTLLGSLTTTPDIRSQVRFSITYPVRTVTPAVLWSDTANSNPFADFQAWYVNLFFTPAVMIIGRNDWWNLMQNAHFIRQLGFETGVGAGTSPTAVSAGKLIQFFSEALGVKVIVYNARYTTKTITDPLTQAINVNKILPDGKIIILPADPVGYTATSPAPQNDYATGFYSWTRDPQTDPSMRDPWRYEVGVGYNGLPILQHPDWTLVGTVA